MTLLTTRLIWITKSKEKGIRNQGWLKKWVLKFVINQMKQDNMMIMVNKVIQSHLRQLISYNK